MSDFALHLAGAVALLLWSVRMIRTGVERAFATQLRAGLRRAAATSVTAAAGGAVAAFSLQSSTAVAVLAAGFVGAGTLAAPAGLALVLGADLGSALVARVLVQPADLLVPVLLVLGVPMFLRGTGRRTRQLGRIVIGLALVLVSLSMIRASTAPLAESEPVALVVAYLSADPIGSFAIGAILAWAMHSSLAAVLTFVAFAAEGALPVGIAAALVLGANLGGALIPVPLTLAAPPAARRVVLGNLALRGGGAVLALWALTALPGELARLGAPGFEQVVNLHVAFNAAMALAALPFIRPVLALIAAVEPRPAPTVGEAHISALDEAALADPEQGLACAAREVLRMGENVNAMLAPSLGLFRRWNDGTAETIADLERTVDRMHFETKLYIARLQERDLSEAQARRAMSLAGIASGLEEAGDQISTKLLRMARRMTSEGLGFSADGWRDLQDFHDRVLTNAQLSLNVMMTADPAAARHVVEEKERARRAEQQLQQRHIARLRNDSPASIETSNMHQETLRALKQVNTAFSMAAYPIAEEAGDLLASRLAVPEGTTGTGAGSAS